ncbi:hypothetical protein CKAH01_00031 [Colletotrichum kahawae]|uniref:Uncharacterized protein n=1 Tax=Colletotrichum kahawae TaxID=34407 RepID=A0AAE0DE17_COLKA|nr:hypothetical protein CKAH01_00031 [Colletotrichum kahawae]
MKSSCVTRLVSLECFVGVRRWVGLPLSDGTRYGNGRAPWFVPLMTGRLPLPLSPGRAVVGCQLFVGTSEPCRSEPASGETNHWHLVGHDSCQQRRICRNRRKAVGYCIQGLWCNERRGHQPPPVQPSSANHQVSVVVGVFVHAEAHRIEGLCAACTA